eukprot:11724792-Heterocapsa_arctica.AAC.1
MQQQSYVLLRNKQGRVLRVQHVEGRDLVRSFHLPSTAHPPRCQVTQEFYCQCQRQQQRDAICICHKVARDLETSTKHSCKTLLVPQLRINVSMLGVTTRLGRP